ncbi:MazG family protein [Arsenicicoccus sp. oral taxon 190]|uniref:MazG family protein n=1 Tax=Arsenicicoccus sp. oral taxon 190 TaxID=1658671 RepID=UPI00067A3E1E|nr:MazG family protein [Arsenicicoccus sp. oral taxon 190]AKT50186.1 nucleoside triphosphate hydrolase [Arsenicicoccus sp. oral taxon 190]
MTGTAPVGPTPRGARLLELVQVMDRLRSPGGCPWDAEQTHETLAPYAVEEAHELADAIASGDRAHLVEELGDVLLQVVFHARVGQEHPDTPFDVDDVAAGIIAKLERRHPHVFADTVVSGAADVEANWETIKAAEKPHRSGVLDGVPASLPALALAGKLASRLERSGRGHLVADAADAATDATGAPGEDLGAALLALVLQARARGIDPEQALRATVRDVAAAADRPT